MPTKVCLRKATLHRVLKARALTWFSIPLKEELPRLLGTQYATGDQWRNNSTKNEETEPKQKQHPVVDMTGDGTKV